MKTKKIIFLALFLVITVVILNACKIYYFRSNYKDVNYLLHETKNIQTKPFLKSHLKNGNVCVLKDSWQIDTIKNIVIGYGIQYDFNRREIFSGTLSIPIDSVAIFETNEKILNSESGRITALSILAGVDAIVGIICLTNPKACFGSCPTFYINEKNNFHYSDAEGFSNAISPSMEYFDIDALNNKTLTSNSFSITMKNEALETHCVNDVKLLAYPRKNGERIYQSSYDDFYLCKNNYSVSQAKGAEGNITSLLKNYDHVERFSLSDPTNLSSKEEIFLDFDNVDNTNALGLIVNFRQTLMTTYLFYSSIGYMGNNVSDVFSLLETNNELRNKFNATTKELGNIEILMWNEKRNSWEKQNKFFETGPIAINKQIIPLKNTNLTSKIKLKIILNKGLWRIDYLALTNIYEKVKPIELSPSMILNKGKEDSNALQSINDPKKYLISMPGSEYKFNFILPASDSDYELFLYSKGYYLEWMREHWIKDENMFKLRQMVESPKTFLKTEAKDYKLYEKTMEQEFWDSKIDTKSFSYYDKYNHII